MTWAAQKNWELSLELQPALHSGFVVLEGPSAGLGALMQRPVYAGTLADCLAYMGGRHLGPEHRASVTIMHEPIPPNWMHT